MSELARCRPPQSGNPPIVEHQRVRQLGAAGKQRPWLLLRDPDLAGALDLARRTGGAIRFISYRWSPPCNA
jgi:hypothetical protein